MSFTYSIIFLCSIRFSRFSDLSDSRLPSRSARGCILLPFRHPCQELFSKFFRGAPAGHGAARREEVLYHAGMPRRKRPPRYFPKKEGSRWGPTQKEPSASATPYPPTGSPAVLSAMGGLTAEFGMGSGDPPLHGRARGGRPSKASPRPYGTPGCGSAPPPWRLQAFSDPTARSAQ